MLSGYVLCFGLVHPAGLRCVTDDGAGWLGEYSFWEMGGEKNGRVERWKKWNWRNELSLDSNLEAQPFRARRDVL
jgi:hypothetical protein